VIRLKANSGGPALPINVGIKAASGELIAVLDQDDAYAHEILERGAEALTQATHCPMAFWWFGDLDNRDAGPRQSAELRELLVARGESRGSFLELPGKMLLAELVTRNNFLAGYPAFMFRRSAWQRKGGVDESLRISSDADMLGWLFQQGPCALIPRVGYFRRVHDSNACRNATLMYLESAEVIARLVQTAEGLREDPAVRGRVASWLRGLAYWFRQGHEYAAARRVHRLLVGLGDRRMTTWGAMAKLEAHRALAMLLRRRPQESPFTVRRRPVEAAAPGLMDRAGASAEMSAN
jgi:hypothetical protein